MQVGLMHVRPSDECLAHWNTVREKIRKGMPVNTRHPKTLREKAQIQIDRLEREIEEWKTIQQKDT